MDMYTTYIAWLYIVVIALLLVLIEFLYFRLL